MRLRADLEAGGFGKTTVKRMRKWNKPTRAVNVYFQNNELLTKAINDRVRSQYLTFAVDRFNHLDVIRCYNCHRYKPTASACPNNKACVNCQEIPRCVDCKGNHRASSITCPVYVKLLDTICSGSIQANKFSSSNSHWLGNLNYDKITKHIYQASDYQEHLNMVSITHNAWTHFGLLLVCYSAYNDRRVAKIGTSTNFDIVVLICKLILPLSIHFLLYMITYRGAAGPIVVRRKGSSLKISYISFINNSGWRKSVFENFLALSHKPICQKIPKN